jgi:hypothetical protein
LDSAPAAGVLSLFVRKAAISRKKPRMTRGAVHQIVVRRNNIGEGPLQ